MKLNNLLTFILAGLMLAATFGLAIFSAVGDSATFDEVAHIPAGYSYLSLQDYRLNPEHPPLAKDLSTFPLLFLKLNFPENHPSWIQEDSPVWWHQFNVGSAFLYESGNNPDQIIFWSRLPMILLLIFLGGFIFFWTRKLYNNQTALIALFLFSFSPTLLAHGRLVTTDVPAALGIALAMYFWLKFLKTPSAKNIFLAGIILGISLLFKFSLVILIPLLGLITIIHSWLNKKSIFKQIGFAIIIGLIALIVVIWPVYQLHILNYPVAQQVRDTNFVMETSSTPAPLARTIIWMSDKPGLRPLAHFFLGVSMVINRGAGGNTTYFLGQMSAQSWKSYFPLVYLIKESLAFHILTLLALVFGIFSLFRSQRKNWFALKKWLIRNFTEFTLLVFIAFYWFISIIGNLNIGIRHLIPVIPLTIILVSWQIGRIRIKRKLLATGCWLLVVLLLFWHGLTAIKTFPHYIAYFNELIGGSEQGYKYVTDSNLDWGQDLKRLADFVEKNNIQTIYLDYFGGGSPSYELGDKYQSWDAKQKPDQLPPNSWFAVSVNELQGGRAIPVKGFDQKTDYYNWLNKYEPETIIGHSIFVYYIK